MSWRKLLILFVGVLALGGYTYFVEFKGAEKRREREERAQQVFQVDWEKINQLTLIRPSEHITLKKVGSQWRIIEPIADRADEFVVERLYQSLRDLMIERVVDSSKAAPAPYGLDKPELRVKLLDTDNYEVGELQLGKKSPVGNSRYVLATPRNQVVLVRESIASELNKSLFELRNKYVLGVFRDSITSITLARANQPKVYLEKEHDRWYLRKTIMGLADEAEVGQMLSTLEALQVKEFVVDRAESLAQYGLDPPQLSAEITVGPPAATQTLLLGKRKNGLLYAKLESEDRIVAVEGQTLDRLAKSPKELRIKKLLDFQPDQVEALEIRSNTHVYRLEKHREAGWQMVKPSTTALKEEALTSLFSTLQEVSVKQHVDQFSTKLQLYGLQDPQQEVELWGHDGKSLGHLLIGKKVKDGIYAMMEGEPWIYVVDQKIQKTLDIAVTSLTKSFSLPARH